MPTDDFEKELRALEKAVEKLEQGDFSLEESCRFFEQGVASAKKCRDLLRAVESRVEVLLQDARGEYRTEPLAGNDEAEDGDEG